MNDKITLLVIDRDRDYAEGIVNCAKSHSAFLDASYAISGLDGMAMIETIKPSAVIINFLLPELDGIGILRKLKDLNRDVRPFIIIVASAMTPAMINAATEHGADYFMIKPQPPGEVCNTIADLITLTPHNQPIDTPESKDIKITRFIHYMGIPANLSGYEYIRSSLLLAIDDISILSPITLKLYPYLAKKYNKTPQSIERSIRHAIKVSWERGNKKVLHDVFGVAPDNPYQYYPTNSEYIAMLADDLRLRLKHNIAI